MNAHQRRKALRRQRHEIWLAQDRVARENEAAMEAQTKVAVRRNNPKKVK